MSKETTSIFQRIWSATQEMIDSRKQTLAQEKIKRKFQAAWDDAESKIIDAKENIEKEYDKMKAEKKEDANLDIVKVINFERDIADLEDFQKSLKDLHSRVFGDDLKK